MTIASFDYTGRHAVITGAVDGTTAAMTVTVRPAPNPNAPAVTSIAPATLRPGALYTVTGANFATTPGGNLVFVDGVPATVQTASPTQLTIALPATGFTIACFPVKIRGASAGWTRAVAIFDDEKR